MQSKVTRRDVLKTAAAGAAGLTLGTTVPRRSFAAQSTPITLTWWDYYAEGSNAEAMDAQLGRYMEANSNVTIERTAIPFADLKTKLLQGAAAGELEQLWSDLTRSQRQVLGAVAEGETKLLSARSLETMGLGKSTAQQARDVLEAEGCLRSDGQALAVTDPFLARWLQRGP